MGQETKLYQEDEDIFQRVDKFEKYVDYLSQSLEQTIAYAEYLASKMDPVYMVLIKAGYELPSDKNKIEDERK